MSLGGSLVADGKHTVPHGVAVEELDNRFGANKLRDECPPDLVALLRKHGLFDVYDKMVQSIVQESKTRRWLGKWNDTEFQHILDQFREDFAEKGVNLAYCKRSSAGSSYRWVEFIDVQEAPDYVPQVRAWICRLPFDPYRGKGGFSP